MFAKILVTALVCAMAAPLWAQQQIQMRLHEAIALALRDNLDVRNAYLDRISDKFSYKVAEDDYMPQYSLSTSLDLDSTVSSGSRTEALSGTVSADTTLNIPDGGQLALTLSQTSTLNREAANDHSGSLTLSYTLPLLRGYGEGIADSDLIAARYTEASSKLSLKSSIISTVTSVIQQYRSYVSALNSLKIAELALQRSQEQVETNRELIKAGRIPQVDLVQSETDLANQKLSLRSTQNTVDNELVSLQRLLRISSRVKIVPTEPLTVAPTQFTIEELVDRAKINQPDYRQAELTLKSAELTRKLARDEQRWDLEFSTSYALSGDDARLKNSLKDYGEVDQGDYALGLTLTVPIDEIDRDQTLIDANVNWVQAKNDFIDTNESLRLDLISAMQSIESAWDNVGLAEKSLELSRQQLELEKEKQRAGMSTNFQVVSYQDDLATAENTYLDAQIDYLNELTELDELLGTTLDHWGIEMLAENQLQPDNIFDFASDTDILE